VIIRVSGSSIVESVNVAIGTNGSSVFASGSTVAPVTLVISGAGVPGNSGVQVNIPEFVTQANQAISASYAGTASFAFVTLGNIESSSYAEYANAVSWSNVVNTPDNIVSASSQISYPALSDIPVGIVSSSTQLPTGLISGSSQLPTGLVSSSAQLPTGLVSSSAQLPVGVVSSSTQAAAWTVATASVATVVDYTGVVNLPTLVSASTQIDYAGVTNKPIGIVSSSTQVSYSQISNIPTGIVSGAAQVTALLPNNTVSSSAQISYPQISNIPVGIVSGSSQVTAMLPNGTVSSSAQLPTGLISSSAQLPVGVVSSSVQVSYTGLSNTPVGIISSSAQLNALPHSASIAPTSWSLVSNIPTGLVSSSAQLPSSLVSSSAQLPTGLISSSAQLPIGIISSSTQLPAGIVSSSAQATTWTVATASVATSSSFAVSASWAPSFGGGSGLFASSSVSASWASQSLSSSFATTSSFAVSAAWAPGAGSSATSSYISGGVVIIGLPTDGTYGGAAGNVSGIASSDKVEDAFDKVELILGKLAPAKPPLLSTRTLTIPNVYTALEVVTGTSRTTIVTSSLPTASWTLVPATSGSNSTLSTDGDVGTLSAEFDGGVSAGSIRTMTTASDTGTFGNLIISQDLDPYAGTFGQQGFWTGFIARTAPTSALATGSHTTRLIHSIGGATPLYTFYIDNPRTPTVASMSLSSSAYTGRYISGVPSLATGDIITTVFTGSNAVSLFYNSTRINAGSSNVASTVNQALPASPPVSGAFISASVALTILTSQYQETASFSGNTYNSQGVTVATAITASQGTTNLIRVDTVSTENRLHSGIGQYPTIGTPPSGAGGPWSAQASRSLVDTRELQMINGIYQYPPARTYIRNYPIAGPDYTTLVPDTFGSLRWFTVSQSISALSALSITFNGAVNFNTVETTGSMRVYVLVSGSTPTNGWVDASTAYGGTGNPTNNGDPALVIGSSTTTLKRVTFGAAALTGVAFVRIGLPTGSARTFTSITISS
jgi:hypothetical protein